MPSMRLDRTSEDSECLHQLVLSYPVPAVPAEIPHGSPPRCTFHLLAPGFPVLCLCSLQFFPRDVPFTLSSTCSICESCAS